MFRPRVLALIVALLLAPLAVPARSAALAPGDLLMLRGQPWTATWSLLRVNRSTGAPIDTLSSGGALLSDPRGLVALPDGTVLVADRLAGLVRIDPLTGAQSTFVPATSFSAAGPTGVAREPSGNLVVVCGDASGIWRVSPAGAVSAPFSAGGGFTYANAIAVAADGGLWVADGMGQVVRVDPVTGAQAPLSISGVTWATPIGIALGKGATSVYVMMQGYFFYHHLAGTYVVDRATGAGAIIPNAMSWAQGVAADTTTDDAFVSSIDVINHDTPYQGVLTRGAAGAWTNLASTGAEESGLLAIVPSAATPAARATWGRLKADYR